MARRATRPIGIKIVAVLFLLLLATAGPLVAQDAAPFALGSKETIVFVGDSITAAGDYVLYVEAGLRTRFPDRSFRVVRAGRRSETLSGLTEPPHPGPRPTLFERFERDVAAAQPTWTVACYGMNDGIYHPYSEERQGCFQQGVGQLIANVRALKSRLLLLTPPAWDGHGRAEPVLAAGETYSWKRPFPGYDDVLHRYSEWLKTLRAPDVEVADLHAAFKAHLERRREQDPSFRIQKDSIHPDATGHLLMAMAVLEAWRVPAAVAEAVVDVSARKVQAGDVALRPRIDGDFAFTWTSPLPIPVDARWDPASVAHERFAERFNRQTLTLLGLAPGRYTLLSEGEELGVFTAEELAAGVDVAARPAWPGRRRAAQLLDRLRARSAAEGEERARLESEIEAACRPASVGLRLRTVSLDRGGAF